MDGLVYWNNSIIGVADNVIMQYDLNPAEDQLIGEKIIDQNNEHFHDPTTAALYDNKLFVISNSYLTPYNNNKESVAGIDDQLGPVVILVYGLEHRDN
jgi:hypothetical protein